ncbi:MAG TPA: recombinase [Porphyromonadaceae bacterium]|jgi:integrase/recombinase XerC|nr:recombinase [Porphyromonadaceae bacterium]
MWKEKFIDYLRYEKNYSSLTEISYLNDITQFEEFVENEIGNFVPSEIDVDIIRIWMSTLIEKGMKPSTVNRKLSSLKAFFNFMEKKKHVSGNPAKLVSGIKTPKVLPVFVNDKEMTKILDNPENYSDDFKGYRDRFLIELFYVTGIRRAELISLKDNDIDFNTCTLKIMGKGNKERFIPFSDETKKKIQEYINVRDAEIENKSAFLFVKEDGEPLYPELVYKIIHDHLKNISTLSKKSPHVLRHSFATEMMNNGAEINAVKELLGHSSLSSTEIYTHVTFEEMKKTYQNAHPRAKK